LSTGQSVTQTIGNIPKSQYRGCLVWSYLISDRRWGLRCSHSNGYRRICREDAKAATHVAAGCPNQPKGPVVSKFLPQDPAVIEPPERLLSPIELAVYLGVSSRQVDRWTRDHQIPVISLGYSTRRYSRKAVEEALNNLTLPPRVPPKPGPGRPKKNPDPPL